MKKPAPPTQVSQSSRRDPEVSWINPWRKTPKVTGDEWLRGSDFSDVSPEPAEPTITGTPASQARHRRVPLTAEMARHIGTTHWWQKRWFQIKLVNTFKKDSVNRGWAWAVPRNDVALINEMRAHGFLPPAGEWDLLNQLLFSSLEFLDGKMARRLLMSGANPNARIMGDTGDSPAHRAVRQGNTRALKALIKEGADLTLRDVHGDTPMLAALDHRRQVSRGFRPRTSMDERWALAEMCLEAGADIMAVNHDGLSLLNYALQDNPQKAEWALDEGAPLVNPQKALADVLWKPSSLEKVRQQFEPKYRWDRWGAVDVLLNQCGANLDAPDLDGVTPIEHGLAKGAMTADDLAALRKRGSKIESVVATLADES